MDYETLYCPQRPCTYYGVPFRQSRMVKNGTSYGQAQVLCKACGSSVSLSYGTAYYGLEAEPAIFELAVRALAEGNSLRATGRIVQVRKDVLGENNNDDPRQLQLSIMVRVTWENLRTGEILAQDEVPIAPESIPLIAQAGFAPELGQSQATATQIVIDQLAKHIASMMEAPWGNPERRVMNNE